MRQSLFLCLSLIFIYTCYLYVQGRTFTKQIFCGYPDEKSQDILIGIDCFTMLFGGMVAAFIIVPPVLFSLSLICLLIGVVIFEIQAYWFSDDTKHPLNCMILYYMALALLGVFYGLFRFIIVVMILNQSDSVFIRQKSEEWLMVLNFCYMTVYVFLPVPLKTNNYIALCIPMMFIGVGLLILGENRYYEVYSEPISIKSVIEIFQNRSVLNQSFTKEDERKQILKDEPNNKMFDETDFDEDESRHILQALSRSIIIFILIIPYGICDSQSRYAYMYQSNHLRQGTLQSYFNGRSNLWPMFFNSFTVVFFLAILWFLKKFFPTFYYKIYPENIKYRIICGNILMILSTLMNGGLETYRLEVFWGFNRTTMIPSSKSLNQTIGNENFQAADLSIFYMVPQTILLGLSEVYCLLACIEVMNNVSMKNMKYLSISLLLSAMGNGGLSDFFFIIIGYFNIFNPRNLNERSHNDMGLCCSFESRLDYVLYGLAVLAFLSLFISIILMQRFPIVFESQDLEKNTIQLNKDLVENQ